jgi:hypothetical protein
MIHLLSESPNEIFAVTAKGGRFEKAGCKPFDANREKGRKRRKQN